MVEVAVVVEEAPEVPDATPLASLLLGVVVEEGGGYPPMGGSPLAEAPPGPPPRLSSFIYSLIFLQRKTSLKIPELEDWLDIAASTTLHMAKTLVFLTTAAIKLLSASCFLPLLSETASLFFTTSYNPLGPFHVC